MCTALTWNHGDFYFGRNMDIEYSFGEAVVFVPRNFPITYKQFATVHSHFAMIGMASVVDDYPLFAEAMNESGLCMAGLNFPGYAHYHSTIQPDGYNIAPYELIPWILGNCSSVAEAKPYLEKLNLINTPFTKELPLAPLHFILADKHTCLVMEPMEDGVRLFDNPIGVLTNNPTFDFHMTHLRNYLHLMPTQPQNQLAPKLNLKPLGQGTGGLGLPGDVSPTSRFIRTVFAKSHSVCKHEEGSNLAQFFHILDSVSMIRGTVITPEGLWDMTTYASCMNANQGIYYYKTYENNQIGAVYLHHENLKGNALKTFPLINTQRIHIMN